ncbi:MAG: amphi-Trp domain-containing protein [Desulfovibrio sp.]|uniref:amphi-Trp domain-containing protein n=1 Tax=Desulfovibrio sp. 7SRBS1 TaxID=3378064 RepID=UPI003B3EF808
MKVEKIDIEGNLKLESVCTYLEDIAASLRAGRVCLSRNTDFVTLTPSDLLEVSIAAGSKKGKEKLSLRLEWKTELNSPDSQTIFAVSTEEPVQESEPEKSEETAAQEPEQKACPTKAAESPKEGPAQPAETKAEAAPKAAEKKEPAKPAAKKPATKGKKASK